MKLRLAFAKPEKRSTTKRRKDRQETEVAGRVRETVEDRDKYCRLYVLDASWREQIFNVVGACDGPSEWAHLRGHKRSETRGMAPELRHTTGGSVMFCRGHHVAEERNVMTVEAKTERGADGPLSFTVDGNTYTEPM